MSFNPLVVGLTKLDLLDAKNSLLKTIKEIEGTATDKFMDAFNKVRTNFIDVFRSLFTEEDQCDLVLMDKGDPLESNIDIIAKPKGKRPQSINQLSGGEKSRLVLATMLGRPLNLLILDETFDSSLDDDGVDNLMKIINSLGEDTHVFVISHKGELEDAAFERRIEFVKEKNFSKMKEAA